MEVLTPQLGQGQISHMQDAFSKIETLTIGGSSLFLLEGLVKENIIMPAIRKLVLEADDDAIRVEDLEQFFRRNGCQLQVLHFECGLLNGKAADEGTSFDDYPPLAVCYLLYRIGQYCQLREVQMGMVPRGLFSSVPYENERSLD